MPDPTVALPVVAHTLPVVAAVLSGPWWALPVLTLVTGIVLVYLTEWAKSKFAKPRTDTDILVATKRIESDELREMREMFTTSSTQYLSMVEKYNEIQRDYRTLMTASFETLATTKVQSVEIDRLRDDVKELQAEKNVLKGKIEAEATRSAEEVASLKIRVTDLEAKISEKDREIARLENLLVQSELRAVALADKTASTKR